MPPLEHRDLTQKAVLRAVVTTDGYPRADDWGEVLVGAGVEVKVRWEKVYKVVTGADGNPREILAEVAIAQNVVVGSIMRLGILDDETGTGGDDVEYLQVVGVNESVDLKGRTTRWELSLSRYKGQAITS